MFLPEKNPKIRKFQNIPEFFDPPWPCITITRCWNANLPELSLQAFSHPSHALQDAMTHWPGHGKTHGSVSDGVQSHWLIGTSLFHLSRHFQTLILDPELQFPTYGWHSPIDFKTGVKQFGSRHDLYWIRGSHSDSEKRNHWKKFKIWSTGIRVNIWLDSLSYPLLKTIFIIYVGGIVTIIGCTTRPTWPVGEKALTGAFDCTRLRLRRLIECITVWIITWCRSVNSTIYTLNWINFNPDG